ncbi:SNF2 family N-terminal domain-containing protein, partial [Thamnocephalis sphaerospora]
SASEPKSSEHLGVATLQPSMAARQPSLITGGVLKEYQLAGVEWLVSLYENGLNGILADEMGLGKTLQCISFIAYLRERGVWGPYLITAPLSTLANWVCEFRRFAPDIPVILYHGTVDERQHLRNKKMRRLDPDTFPVIVTSYEMVMNDRKHLEKFAWKYIIVDEGHRIKNLNCKLIRELKACRSANRLLLTGTPLQNNLSELWSLLNFLLPDIFDDLESFQNWWVFDFSDLNEQTGQQRIMGEEAESRIVSKLHQILKPFLLRRLKSDVEHMLPKKREYILYAPLSEEQKEIYDAIMQRRIREYIIQRKLGNNSNATESANGESGTGRSKSGRPLGANDYDESISDDEYIMRLEKERDEPSGPSEAIRREREEAERRNNAGTRQHHRSPSCNLVAICASAFARLTHARAVNRMHLQSRLVQVLKVCNHPMLFDDEPLPDPITPAVAQRLVAASGKMRILDQLLPALFARGHRVLIFSQMARMLDLIEVWVTEVRGWNTFRIDGLVKQDDRRRMIAEFNSDRSGRYPLFLLSTRAGGLGINLTSADTVILFDSDWNPQMDLQAQDRVHRIGQTKPVVIYRLATDNTLESRVLECATAKRKLEKLVIHRGRFRDALDRQTTAKPLGMKELAEILLEDELETVHERTLPEAGAPGERSATSSDNADEDGSDDEPGDEPTRQRPAEKIVARSVDPSDPMAPLLSAADLSRLLDRSEAAYVCRGGPSSALPIPAGHRGPAAAAQTNGAASGTDGPKATA